MTTNSQNYIGATVTLVGYASGPATPPKYDSDGSKGILELRVPISEGYKKDGQWVEQGTTWYSVTAAGDYAEKLKSIQKGDKVRIEDAKQEVREYETQSGEKKLGISLRFGNISVVEAKNTADTADPWA